MSDAVACTTEQNLLGEGARWDARRDELLRVDIMAGRVFRDRVAGDGSLIPVGTYNLLSIGNRRDRTPSRAISAGSRLVVDRDRTARLIGEIDTIADPERVLVRVQGATQFHAVQTVNTLNPSPTAIRNRS